MSLEGKTLAEFYESGRKPGFIHNVDGTTVFPYSLRNPDLPTLSVSLKNVPIGSYKLYFEDHGSPSDLKVIDIVEFRKGIVDGIKSLPH